MIEPYLPIVYAGIAGAVIAVSVKAYFGLAREKIRIAAKERVDMSKPEAAIDNILQQINSAPEALAVAQAELADIRKKNPNADLKAQEEKLKWLQLLATHRDKAMLIAPIAAPFLKNIVKGLSKAF